MIKILFKKSLDEYIDQTQVKPVIINLKISILITIKINADKFKGNKQ